MHGKQRLVPPTISLEFWFSRGRPSQTTYTCLLLHGVEVQSLDMTDIFLPGSCWCWFTYHHLARSEFWPLDQDTKGNLLRHTTVDTTWKCFECWQHVFLETMGTTVVSSKKRSLLRTDRCTNPNRNELLYDSQTVLVWNLFGYWKWTW